MSKVIITGCAGFIGSHLAEHFLANGHEVIGIDDLSGGYRDFVPVSPRMKFHALDLNDFESVSSIFRDAKPTHVYHFAAYAAEGLSPFVRRYNYQRNLLASASIINASIETGTKIIFASSMAVYGDQVPPFTEDMPFQPVDPYGIAKASVERDLYCAGMQHELEWTVVRPHNVVGIRQNIWDRYRNVLGIFVRKALTGEPLTVYGDGSQLRAFSDVKFYLDPFTRLLDSGHGKTYNLGSDSPTSIMELAKIVQSVAGSHGVGVNIEFLEARHEVKYAYCDHSAAKRDLGFEDQTDLFVTVNDVFEWAMKQPDRGVVNIPYEIKKGIYSYWK